MIQTETADARVLIRVAAAMLSRAGVRTPLNHPEGRRRAGEEVAVRGRAAHGLGKLHQVLDGIPRCVWWRAPKRGAARFSVWSHHARGGAAGEQGHQAQRRTHGFQNLRLHGLKALKTRRGTGVDCEIIIITGTMSKFTFLSRPNLFWRSQATTVLVCSAIAASLQRPCSNPATPQNHDPRAGQWQGRVPVSPALWPCPKTLRI